MDRFFELLPLFAVGIVAVNAYLQINKMWPKKHIPEVAQSYSVLSAMLGLMTGVVFLVSCVRSHDWVSTANWAVVLMGGAFWFMVASGFWVRRGGRMNVWQKILGAFRAESGELGNLVHAMSSPHLRRRGVDLLVAIAAVDGEIDPSERTFIVKTAEGWGLSESDVDLHLGRAASSLDRALFDARHAAKALLRAGPARREIEAGLDLIRRLAYRDGEVSDEEAVLIEELEGEFDRYLGSGALPRFEVVAVPRSEAQALALLEIGDAVEQTDAYGGNSVVLGRFFTEDCARTVCRRYRALDLFVTVVDASIEPRDELEQLEKHEDDAAS